jgi:hypothetical protein
MLPSPAMGGWSFYHLSGPDALYVYLTHTRSPEPVRFPCTGLEPSFRRRLRDLVPGDEVPPDLVRALEDLSLGLGRRRPPHATN